VREVEIRAERMDAWLNIPKPKVDAATTEHVTRNVPRQQAGEYYRTMYDLILLALRTDMTRVVSYMSARRATACRCRSLASARAATSSRTTAAIPRSWRA